MAGQLQALLTEKALLAQENARLARENTGLQVSLLLLTSYLRVQGRHAETILLIDQASSQCADCVTGQLARPVFVN